VGLRGIAVAVNEYWLRDRELLARYAPHHATGEPMPAALI
jgi:Zn-dependent oligopeptidase